MVSSEAARGTAEQWIKKGKKAVRWTRLPFCLLDDNQVRLQRLALPTAVKHWSLTTLRK
ncbi:MAG: hypothetical protein RIE32_01645 [Phycisphaerales bacterium]